MKVRYPVIAGILLLVAHAILSPLLLYVQYPVLDIPMHFTGGFIAAWFFAAYFKNEQIKISKIAGIVIIIGGTAIVGVAWEWMEWIVDNVFLPNHPFMGGLDDTLLDLVMDLLGGAVIAFIAGRRRGTMGS
ncbi:MAG: hypothetical protein Q8R20_01395 [Nanoarchaeota archaeon]|nr:hypothetical protein [Nanoarchaeota archaeon]